jgi:steroid delta-isomerase-like uncharacterized protein
MTAESNVELMKQWVDAINRNELSAIEESVARDFIRHDLSGASPDLMGIERLTEFIKTLRAGLPDMEVTIEDIFATDDRVAMSITTVGTHAGEFLGFPPSGKRVQFAGINLYRIAGGRIAETWQLQDLAGLMRQLGAASTA